MPHIGNAALSSFTPMSVTCVPATCQNSTINASALECKTPRHNVARRSDSPIESRIVANAKFQRAYQAPLPPRCRVETLHPGLNLQRVGVPGADGHGFHAADDTAEAPQLLRHHS